MASGRVTDAGANTPPFVLRHPLGSCWSLPRSRVLSRRWMNRLLNSRDVRRRCLAIIDDLTVGPYNWIAVYAATKVSRGISPALPDDCVDPLGRTSRTGADVGGT